MRTPETLADHHHRRRSRPLALSPKEAAPQWLHSQDGEIFRRDELAKHSLGSCFLRSVAGDAERDRIGESRSGRYSVPLWITLEVGVGHQRVQTLERSGIARARQRVKRR